jgi:hypothetical protein
MAHTWKYSLLLLCSLSTLGADEEALPEVEEKKEVADASHVFFMSRSEGLPDMKMEDNTDHYLEGYIQALVDMHYYEHQVVVIVEDRVVYLYNLPNNSVLANSIVSFVQDIPCVCEVKVRCELTDEECQRRKGYVQHPCISGIWFPQLTVLYPPMIADPRQVMYSVAYRAGDKVVGKKAIAIALGDNFPVYRWLNVFPWCGDLQIGIEAGIWAPFNFEDVPHVGGTCCELINTDYLLGIPLDYAVDRWAFRLRIYHISSHLGDEFLVNHPWFLWKRLNPSFEALEFLTSCQVTRYIRLYGGAGVILHSDKSFPMKTGYFEYGAEARWWPTRFCYQRLYGAFFFAVDVQNWQVRDWNFDWTVKGGYEISKLQGVGRKMRVFASYHDGYSYEGQFFLLKTRYGEFGFSWGF